MSSKKNASKPVVQAKLNFASTKASAAPSSKAGAKSVDTVTTIKSKAVTASRPQIIKPTAEPVAAPKPAPQKRRAVDTDDDEEDEEEDDEFYVDESDAEEAEAVHATRKEEVIVEPEVHEVSSTSEDEAPASKKVVRVQSLKDLLKDQEFKNAHKEAMADAGGQLVGT